MSLLDTADVLRCIFSSVLAIGDCKTYKCIRLVCKKFKTVLDTVNVKPLLLSSVGPKSREVQFAKSHYLANYRYRLANDVDVQLLIQAPKQVLRVYFLIEPTRRLRELDHKCYESFTLLPDPENKLFRHHFRSIEEDYYGMELLGHLKGYLRTDEEVRLAYKSAVVELLHIESSFYRKSAAISRELFGAIGLLLSFTAEELTMKIDIKTRALLTDPEFLPIYNSEGLDGTAIMMLEEDLMDGLYLDNERNTFRYLDPVLDKESKNPRYWSEATLETWLERLCWFTSF